jgi:hypothetical protein
MIIIILSSYTLTQKPQTQIQSTPVLIPAVTRPPVPHPYTFQPSQAVEHVNGFDLNPSALQLRNGTLWLAWDSNRGGSYQIYMKSWNGSIWSPDTILTSGSSNTYPSLTQLLNGTIVLIWTVTTSGFDNLFYRTFTVGTWTTPIQLTSGQFFDESSKAVIAPDSTLWLVWERDIPAGPSTPLSHQVYYKTLKGNLWSADTALTGPSLVNIQPTVMISKHGLVWVSWASSLFSGGSSKIINRNFNGTQWSNNVTLTNPTSTDTQPNMVQDRNGTIWLFFGRQLFTNTTQAQTKLFYKYSGDVGATWTRDTQLTFTGAGNNTTQDLAPFGVQSIDTRLWVFFASNSYFNDYDLYFTTTLNIVPVHDIVLTNIQMTPKTYPYGDAPTNLATITANVTNKGDVSDYFNITMRASNKTSFNVGTVLNTFVDINSSVIVTLNWNTMGVPAGRYKISVTIPPIRNETLANAVDGVGSYYPMMVLLPGDLDKNGCISIIDAGMMGKAFSSTPTRGFWNPDADLDNNFVINVIDFGILASHYSKCI